MVLISSLLLLHYRHFVEANQNMQKYHRLFQVSPERFDKLANLAGSGGASGFKAGSMNDSAYDSQMSPVVNSLEDTEQGNSDTCFKILNCKQVKHSHCPNSSVGRVTDWHSKGHGFEPWLARLCSL